MVMSCAEFTGWRSPSAPVALCAAACDPAGAGAGPRVCLFVCFRTLLQLPHGAMSGGPSGTHLALFDLNTLTILSTPPYLRFLDSPVASLVLCGLFFPVCGQHSFVDPSNPLYICMCRYSRSIDPILLRSASFSMCQPRAWWSPVSHPFVACPIRRPSFPTSWVRRPACRPSWHPACSSTWCTSWVAGLCQEMVNSWEINRRCRSQARGGHRRRDGRRMVDGWPKSA
jgi:hypothetical protein